MGFCFSHFPFSSKWILNQNNVFLRLEESEITKEMEMEQKEGRSKKNILWFALRISMGGKKRDEKSIHIFNSIKIQINVHSLKKKTIKKKRTKGNSCEK